MNAYKKAVLDVSTLRKWISRINGNPRENEETDLSGWSAVALKEDKTKQS